MDGRATRVWWLITYEGARYTAGAGLARCEGLDGGGVVAADCVGGLGGEEGLRLCAGEGEWTGDEQEREVENGRR